MPQRSTSTNQAPKRERAQTQKKTIENPDNDPHGYSTDRGMYGHYHVQAHDARRETAQDRERGLQNSGPDLISDYGAGEGRGRFEGREDSHNFANEFYEDTDNERFREARRNHAFRHGYDESDMRDRDDFTPGQSGGISPGFDEVSSATRKTSSSKKAKNNTKKTKSAVAKQALKTAAKSKAKTTAEKTTSKSKSALGKTKKGSRKSPKAQ